jgi:serine/threonine protein kinase
MESDVTSEDMAAQPMRALWTGPRQDPTRYRVDLVDGTLQSVGDGGEGLVFQATCVINGQERQVALKMHTAARADDYPRLATRAQILAGIKHPNVMYLLDAFVGSALVELPLPVGEDFDVIYTVADWVPGVTFRQAVEAAGPTKGLQWVGQIARAAAFLHEYRSDEAPAGVIHRDIKPSNVRITDNALAVLIDFGIARPHEDGDLTEGAGTYLWRAPEVLGGPGHPGPASDAWGIGALAHWVLTGEPPRLEGAEAVRQRLTRAVEGVSLPDPAHLVRHISQLLETHPDQRPHDLTGWAEELDGLLAGERRKWGWKRPQVLVPSLAGMFAGAVALVLIVTGTFSGATQTELVSGGSYRLPSWNYSDGVTVAQVWSFLRSSRKDLQATFTVTNNRNSRVRHSFDEVIPKGLANSVADVSFSPRPDSTVNRDPVVRYCLNLAPRVHRVLTYDVRLRTPPTSQQYDVWASNWKTATTDDNAQPSGLPCRGTSAKQPTATIDTSGAGVLLTTGKGSAAASSKSGVYAARSGLGKAAIPGSGGSSSPGSPPPVSPIGGSPPPGPPIGGSPPPTHVATWSAAIPVDSTGGVSQVSCASPSFCVSVDLSRTLQNNSNVSDVASWDGSTWSRPISIMGVALTGVSCASSSFCMAVGSSGSPGVAFADLYNGTTWNSVTVAPSTVSRFVGVSCVSNDWCMASGEDTNPQGTLVAVADVYTGGSWVESAPPYAYVGTGDLAFPDVSCVSATHCVVVGAWSASQGGTILVIETYNAGRWSVSRAPNISGYLGLNSTCLLNLCLVVGSYGGNAQPYALSSSDGGINWAAIPPPAGLNLGAVSCASLSLCFAASNLPPGYEGLHGLDNVFTFNGSGWSSPLLVDTTGNTISSISCLSTQFCMATDDSGNAMTYR